MDYSDKYEQIVEFIKLFPMKSNDDDLETISKKKQKKKKNKVKKEGQKLSLNEISSKIKEKVGSFNINKSHKETKKMKKTQKKENKKTEKENIKNKKIPKDDKLKIEKTTDVTKPTIVNHTKYINGGNDHKKTNKNGLKNTKNGKESMKKI